MDAVVLLLPMLWIAYSISDISEDIRRIAKLLEKKKESKE